MTDGVVRTHVSFVWRVQQQGSSFKRRKYGIFGDEIFVTKGDRR